MSHQPSQTTKHRYRQRFTYRVEASHQAVGMACMAYPRGCTAAHNLLRTEFTMSGPAAELSLARRTLIAVGVAIGGSALFLSGCLLLASSLLDRAMPSKQADIALSDDAAEVAKSPTTPSEPASARSRS